ncbi:MAG: D-glycero-beta-D-manno-heptose-7-phosphate kinase [Candidatus Abyssubacteria bacterium]
MEGRIYRELVDNFSHSRIAVVGDIVADVYIFGKPHKLSREAPVIVVRHESEQLVPGSAANTAHNLMSLGASVYPIGVVGEDSPGNAVLRFFDGPRAHAEGIIVDKARHTITKTRIMAGDLHTTKQQVIRIDREPGEAISEETERLLCERLEAIAAEVDGIIVSDYGYDIVGPRIIELVTQLARDKTVVVDSRDRLTQLKGVALATPNESEAEAASGVRVNSDAGVIEAGRRLLETTQNNAVLITRGNRGMMLFERDAPIERIPICGGEDIVDVSGAGDTVAAVATLGLVAGGSFLQAANLANFAASIVVMKSGTATASREELLRVIEGICEKDKTGIPL